MTDKKTSDQKEDQAPAADSAKPKEMGGFEKRAEPTRYGDWDANGRCSDF